MFKTKLLQPGTPAPDFSLIDQNSETVYLKDFIGKKKIILIFYPADFTPVCTSQLCEIKDNYDRLKTDDIEAFGINPFSWESHKKFAEKYDLPFPVLFDPRGKTAKEYNATIIPGYLHRRVVYGIGIDGNICYVQEGKPSVDKILAGIK